MLIGGKYELADVVAGNAGWRTFQAREIVSGRAVLVHQVLERPALKDLEQRHGRVVDTCSSEGVEYVVTEAQPPDRGEERFTRAGAWHVPQSRPEPPPPPAPTGPGDFTRVFQTPANQPAPVFTPAPAPPPTSQDAGEFTRMFRAPRPAQTPPPPAPAPAPPPASVASGEFTRFFQSPLGAATPEVARVSTPAASPPATPPPPPPPQPGEYTRLFQSPGPPAGPAGGSGATGAFLTHSVPASEPLPIVKAGPSDYTRMMVARPPPATEAKSPELPAAPAHQPAPMKPRVPVWLVVLLSFMVVVAIGMILYFALKN